MAVRAYLFDAQGADRAIELEPGLLAALADHQILWVDVSGRSRDEVELIAALLGLKGESVQDLIEARRQPHFENYGDYVQMEVVGIRPVDQRYQPLDLDLLFGLNYVITVHSQEIPFLDSFGQQIRGDSRIGELNSASFLVALLDSYVTSIFQILEHLQAQVDRLDEEALTRPADRRSFGELVVLRRRVARLRRLVASHREVFAALARPDVEVLATPDAAEHIRALNERLDRAIETVENAREWVVGSFEVFMTQTAQQTNDVMRLLTIVTVVLGLVSVVAGIMGMNFEAAFFEYRDAGFWSVVAGMALVASGLLFIAWRRHWL